MLDILGLTRAQLYDDWLPEEFSAVVLVGHNPGLEELANSFRADQKDEHLPTAGWMVVDLTAKAWQDAKAGSGQVKSAGTPSKE